MNIILSKLTLRNFKGIVDKTIEFAGNMNIFGANESGKSTIYTAFNWLLTGKDEFDRKDFEIKNTKRKELNSQSHEVEAVLIVDGREEKLKRVYLEKWVKQKGQSHKTFEGHKTEFWYNDVPCSLSEFQSKVDAIIDSKIIKLVTNPTYFNSLKWDDQRRGLIGIAGEITDRDVFNSIVTPQNDYGTLIMVLNSGKTAEEWKKELQAKKLLLKKSATEYAPRIDEAKRNMPQALDWDSLENDIRGTEEQIAEIDNLLNNASAALKEKQKGLLALQRELHSKETKLQEIRFKKKSEVLEKQNSGTGEISKLTSEIVSIQQTIDRYQREANNAATNKQNYLSQIETKNKIVETLRNDWNVINAERFVFDESKCECPTCKQSLPEHEIEAKREELQTNFNKSVAQRKAEKVATSNQVKAEIKQLQELVDTIDSRDFSALIEAEEAKLPALKSRLAELKEAESKKHITDIELAVDELMRLNAEALNLQEEMSALKIKIAEETALIGSDDDTNKPQRELRAQLLKDVEEIRRQLAIKDTILSTQARIAQLEREESANAQEIANLEQNEFEVETYTRAKMDILEKRVNGMFRYVQFRLFEKQVNGGIAETCVCEYQGVPYPTLNTAAKLLAGLDVLETFSNYYNVHAPVFNDNAESTTYVPPTESQLIRLFVSPADKDLRAEPANHKQLEAA